ncbi:MAG: Holliday junction branch migration protein RuvA [Deltaproteobacteria bacterium]|mgnify:FL=1
MIARISGKLVSKSPESAVIDVHGVGYEVFIPLSTYVLLPEINAPAELLTLTFVKDDSIKLYGFLTREEKEMFNMLLSVSGVGPRLARNILSGASVAEVVSGISASDVDFLKGLPGVGKKTAERVIVDLKDKIGSIVKRDADVSAKAGYEPVVNDVLSALKNLGYKPKDAEEAAIKAKKASKDAGFEEIFKTSLKILSMK